VDKSCRGDNPYFSGQLISPRLGVNKISYNFVLFNKFEYYVFWFLFCLITGIFIRVSVFFLVVSLIRSQERTELSGLILLTCYFVLMFLFLFYALQFNLFSMHVFMSLFIKMYMYNMYRVTAAVR